MLTPITIDNRIRGFIGRPPAGGRRPAVIHLHERYGIVQHTTDLAQKLLDAGYVTIVPDLFSRFIGNREALAAGDARCELSDEEVLQDVDTVAGYLRALPDVDASRIAMSGVCQTGRQPLLISARRDYLSAAVVLYGAIYNDDWKSHPLRAEPVDKLLQQLSCPVAGVFGELDNLVPLDNVLRMCSVLAQAKKSFDIRVYPDSPHGFLNDTMPGRYRPAQAAAAWSHIASFLKSVFDGKWNNERALWHFESDSSVHYDFTKNKRWA
ncbi:MAG TPA: dienelactone hydrolase family protein [Candidatus Binatia bacterium]|nr:dienelactone hydrolase family protein [Candidatus Binatia bacterium]